MLLRPGWVQITKLGAQAWEMFDCFLPFLPLLLEMGLKWNPPECRALSHTPELYETLAVVKEDGP